MQVNCFGFQREFPACHNRTFSGQYCLPANAVIPYPMHTLKLKVRAVAYHWHLLPRGNSDIAGAKFCGCKYHVCRWRHRFAEVNAHFAATTLQAYCSWGKINKVRGGGGQISAAAKEQTRRLDATDRSWGSKFSTPFEAADTTGYTVVEKLILLLQKEKQKQPASHFCS